MSSLCGIYKQAFYRHALNLCGGLEKVRHLCWVRERGALLYDPIAERFALYSNLMDAHKGLCEVGYIKNGVIESVVLFCPQLISMQVLSESLTGARPEKRNA